MLGLNFVANSADLKGLFTGIIRRAKRGGESFCRHAALSANALATYPACVVDKSDASRCPLLQVYLLLDLTTDDNLSP